MLVGLEFVLCGVNQDSSRGRINTAISITNFLDRLYGTVVRHDVNNNVWGESSVQGTGKNVLARVRVRGRRREFRLCRFNLGVVTGRN